MAEGLAEIVAVGSRIWRRGVEKVLGFRADWMEEHPDLVDRLLIALSAAAEWCDGNRAALAELLARPDYVGQSPDRLLPALTGRMILRPGEPPVDLPDFMLFHREATAFPWRIAKSSRGLRPGTLRAAPATIWSSSQPVFSIPWLS